MPGNTLPPSQDKTQNRVVARLEHRERLTSPIVKRQVWLPFPFSYSGPVVDGTESAPWYPEHGLTIYRARFSATTPPAGGGASIEVRLDGVDFAALGLADGEITQITNLSNLRVPSVSFVTLRVDAGEAFGLADVSIGFSVAPL